MPEIAGRYPSQELIKELNKNFSRNLWPNQLSFFTLAAVVSVVFIECVTTSSIILFFSLAYDLFAEYHEYSEGSFPGTRKPAECQAGRP